jgi:hypothetical protein
LARPLPHWRLLAHPSDDIVPFSFPPLPGDVLVHHFLVPLFSSIH